MATSSAGPASIISLPTGGGALRGIGESFRSDPHTGTGTFTVPIAVPPGRNGFQPALDLVYSTGAGNGYFGLGWPLGVAGIARRTSRGVPRYDDTDIFVLSGAEDLVLVDAAAGVYRPRTEGMFARIVRHRDAGHDFWEVRGRDGLTTFYGTTRRRRRPTPPGGPRRATWPSPPGPALAGTCSPGGRRSPPTRSATASSTSTGATGRDGWDQPLLAEIRYADHGAGFLVAVTFEYEERPDPFSDHRAGFEIRTRRRCRAVTGTTSADEVRQRPAVRVRLRRGPLQRRDAAARGARRRLRRAGRALAELPPLEFGYTGFAPRLRDLVTVTGPEVPPLAVGTRGFDLVDLTGDGLPDLLQLDQQARYWRNLGGGRFDRPRDRGRAGRPGSG